MKTKRHGARAEDEMQASRNGMAFVFARAAISLLLRSSLRVFILLLLTLFLSPSFYLAPPLQAQTAETIETVRVDTELVDLNVSVFSRGPRKGAGDLQQKDFAVFENGVQQQVEFFASASAPFDLLLLIDLSGSTSKKLDLIRKSAQRFVDAARPTDRIGIVTFSDEPLVVSALTSNRDYLKEQIKLVREPRGGTNFWDSLRLVLESLFGPAGQSPVQYNRRAVVVMTDGVDNALPEVAGPGSMTTFPELLEIIRRSDTIVLPIYLDTEKEEVKRHRSPASAYVLAREQLEQLASESGSTVYRANKLQDLEGVYEQVIRDLSTVYSIGYRPVNRERDGAWRNITVQIIGHADLAARTKRGYYAK
ncbi:MAG TPA: VWA domain-containing protein [Pyrinomonadaceae bacterium]